MITLIFIMIFISSPFWLQFTKLSFAITNSCVYNVGTKLQRTSEDSGISGSYDRLGHKSVCFLLLPIFYLNLIFQTRAKIHTALQMRHF